MSAAKKFFLVCSVLALFLGGAALAASISGSAFSPNVGEIALDGTAGDGTSYALAIESATGALSGYAWSPYIGWIRFDPPGAYPSNIPGAPQYSARLVGGGLEGWVRACGVFPQGSCEGALRPNYERGGWDGWILLSGVAGNGETYGVFESASGGLSGWAWGSAPVGWIDFSGAAPPAGFTVFLSADPSVGRAPLDVSLTAVVSGFSGGTLTYHFDCENDGVYEEEAAVTDTTYTMQAACSYTRAGTHLASVFVEGGGSTNSAFATIRVLPKIDEVPPR